jgi:hypothetical protein
MNIISKAYFAQKSEEVCLKKFYIGKDPDPDVSQSRTRIQSNFVRIRNTGLNTGAKRIGE